MSYNTIQYNTIQYNTIQYNTIWYIIAWKKSIRLLNKNEMENPHEPKYLFD